MSKRDVFENFQWHSCIGIDWTADGDRKFVSRMPNTKKARAMFITAGKDTLIHKTTRCLWRLSDDKKTIEPVFENDVLTDDEVREAMEEGT